jgi:hypothetical protein
VEVASREIPEAEAGDVVGIRFFDGYVLLAEGDSGVEVFEVAECPRAPHPPPPRRISRRLVP